MVELFLGIFPPTVGKSKYTHCQKSHIFLGKTQHFRTHKTNSVPGKPGWKYRTHENRDVSVSEEMHWWILNKKKTKSMKITTLFSQGTGKPCVKHGNLNVSVPRNVCSVFITEWCCHAAAEASNCCSPAAVKNLVLRSLKQECISFSVEVKI